MTELFWRSEVLPYSVKKVKKLKPRLSQPLAKR